LCTVRIFKMMVMVTYTDDGELNSDVRQMFDKQPDVQIVWPMANVPIFPGAWTMVDENVAIFQEFFRAHFEAEPKYLLDANINRPPMDEEE
jgi:hypothetical protein